MRQKLVTRAYYVEELGFEVIGNEDYPEYLMVRKDQIELHFFLFPDIDPLLNDGQVYIRTNNIETVYNEFLRSGVKIHPAGPLQLKPWGQYEFSLLDPDHNLLTFGENSK